MTPPFFAERYGDYLYYIEKSLFFQTPKNENINLFFIVKKRDYQWTEDKAYEILSQFMKEEIAIGQYAIFKLTLTSKNKEKEYLQFLYKINKKSPKKNKGALLETLIFYAYQNHNKSEFDRLLSRYRDIEMALDEFIPHQNYPSRFELKRRVKFF